MTRVRRAPNRGSACAAALEEHMPGIRTQAEEILTRACADWQVPMEDLLTSRKRRPTIARAAAARALRALTVNGIRALSLVEIGEILGGRDHSSVIYLLRRYTA